MEDVSGEEPNEEVEQSVQTPPQTNGSAEEKVRTPCEALPGWTKVVITRKTGNSAGKSDVYYYSPTGKKVRSKPEIEKLLLQTDGELKDLSKFDYRTGTFVERTTTKKRKKPSYNTEGYGKDLSDFSMASVPVRKPKKLSSGSVTVISSDFTSNGDDGGVGLVSPRQLYWERRLQNMNGQNGLVDYDIFSDTNGEFQSLLHSIVKTLQMERDLVNKKPLEPLGTHKKLTKKPIKITKADIRKQEKEVIKARRELAKAITEYEALKYS